MKERKITYSRQRELAITRVDHLINEALYIDKTALNLNELELKEVPKYGQINFMKLFNDRLNVYIKNDTRIKIEDNFVFIPRELRKEDELSQ